MAITIEYNLEEHGWANVQLSDGSQQIGMAASYLHDTLGDFIGAANLLFKGAPEAKIKLMNEPGMYVIHLRAIDKTNLAIEVRFFYNESASWDSKYEFNLLAADTSLNFSTQVFENAKILLDTYGADGYLDRWMLHDFPIAAYNRLKNLLKR